MNQSNVFLSQKLNILNEEAQGGLYRFALDNREYDNLSDLTIDKLYEFFVDMPYEVAKARTEDPTDWMQRRLKANLLSI